MSLDIDKSDSEIFVIDSYTVSNFLKTSHSIWLKIPGRNGEPHNDTNIRELSPRVKYRSSLELDDILSKNDLNFIKNHPEGWLDKYKNAWDLIKT